MTEQKLDEVLKNLYQNRRPLPPEWNERLKEKQNKKKGVFWQYRKIVVAILLLCLMGVPASVYAYFHYMTPVQVAEEMGLHKLAKQFGKKQNEVKSIISKGYQINYLGIVTGKNLEKGLKGAEVDREKTYIVTAIYKENGTVMTYSDRFFVSPLIEGLEPVHYNLSTMNGSAIRMLQNGILYSITTCDSMGIFADKTMYLAVQEGDSLNSKAYTLNKATGEIKANVDYAKVNVLIPIQLDKSMADQKKADAYVTEVEKGLKESSDLNTKKDAKKENKKLKLPADYIMKFEDITLKLPAMEDSALLSVNNFGYCENENGDDEVWQNIGFFPVIRGQEIKNVSFRIEGGDFHDVDRLSKQEIEKLENPYSALYDKYKNFVHGYKDDKKFYYGIHKKGLDSFSLSAKKNKVKGRYMIRVCSKVTDYSCETMKRDQKRLIKLIEKMKIKMKIERNDGSLIEKTITFKTKKFEQKNLSHNFYYYTYLIQ